MADVDLSIVNTGATIAGIGYAGLIHYFLKKRDEKIDENEKQSTALEKELAAMQVLRVQDKLDAAEKYASKESLRSMFQEAQATNRDNIAQVRGEIKDVKTEIKETNTKLDSMKDAIMAKLDKAS